jgi:hypothetical protein
MQSDPALVEISKFKNSNPWGISSEGRVIMVVISLFRPFHNAAFHVVRILCVSLVYVLDSSCSYAKKKLALESLMSKVGHRRRTEAFIMTTPSSSSLS